MEENPLISLTLFPIGYYTDFFFKRMLMKPLIAIIIFITVSAFHVLLKNDFTGTKLEEKYKQILFSLRLTNIVS